MSYFMIEIDNFDETTAEQAVKLNWRGHGRFQCIRTISVNNNDGLADIKVSYRVDGADSRDFFTQTAKKVEVRGTKIFKMYIHTSDVYEQLEEYLSAETP